MLKTYGYIQSSSESQRTGWHFLSLDDDLSRYYQWFCRLPEKGWDLPINGCHVTFIAGEKEKRIVCISEISRFVHDPVWIEYENKVLTDGRSFWLNCSCPDLDEIRSELGLPSKWRGYHVTLGNIKNRGRK